MGIARKLGTIFAVVAAVALVGTLARTAADPWYVVLEVIEIIGFTAAFILLTVVCEYLALILAQVRGRPLYTLDRTLTRTTLLTSPGEHSDVDYVSGERDRALEQMRRSQTMGE